MAYLYPNEELVAFSTAKWNRIQKTLGEKPGRLKSRTDIQRPSTKPPFPDPFAFLQLNVWKVEVVVVK